MLTPADAGALEAADFRSAWVDSEESAVQSQPLFDKPVSARHREQEFWEKSRIDRALNPHLPSSSSSLLRSEDSSAPVYLAVPRKLPSLFVSASAASSAPSSAACADLWEAARAGSASVQRLRSEEGRTLRDRFWELQRSAAWTRVLGNSPLPLPLHQQQQRTAAAVPAAAAAAAAAAAPETRHLPINQTGVRTELLRVVGENQVTVVVGETGSGKTTQLCQMLLELQLQDGGGGRGMVGVTQPRRVAAVSVAERVAREQKTELGDKVGYAIRFEDKSSAETRIKFMTDGVLLREALLDAELSRYSCIVLDEAHERSLNTDVLLGVLKRIVRGQRGRLKVIVTSATMNVDKFSAFFNNCATFAIPGRTFPVQIFHARTKVADYVAAAVDKVLAILQAEAADAAAAAAGGPRDVLVFLSGQEDVESCCVLLEQRLSGEAEEGEGEAVAVVPLYAQLSAEQQQRAFGARDDGRRRVVVSTNLLESSVTLDVKYVVDAGLAKVKQYSSSLHMDQLVLSPITKANANQRAGRAGRVAPGVCYRLYTEHTYKEMEEAIVPEIRRSNLANTVLLLLAMDIADIRTFEFIDPPEKNGIENAMHLLYLLGAVDASGKICEKGREMAKYPLDPLLSNMVVEGLSRGVGRELSAVVAMLSVPGVFLKTKGDEQRAQQAHEKFNIPESDHLTLLNVFSQFEELNVQTQPQAQAQTAWCSRNFLSAKALRKASEVFQQILDIAAPASGAMATATAAEGSSDRHERVRECVVRGLSVNLSKMRGYNEYVNLINSTAASLLAASAVCGGVNPPFVVYQEVMKTSAKSAFMTCVTAANPLWVDGRLFIVCTADNAATIEAEQAKDAAALQAQLLLKAQQSAGQTAEQPQLRAAQQASAVLLVGALASKRKQQTGQAEEIALDFEHEGEEEESARRRKRGRKPAVL